MSAPDANTAQPNQLSPELAREMSHENLLKLTTNFNCFMEARKWVEVVIEQRIKEIEADASEENDLNVLAFQEIYKEPAWAAGSAWAQMREEMNLEREEMFMLCFLYTAQFKPNVITKLWTSEKLSNRIGGLKKEQIQNVAPTFRTVLYVMAGEKTVKHAMHYAELSQSRLFKEMVIVADDKGKEILDNQALKINEEYYRWLMNGQKMKIGVSSDFPAVLLETQFSFDDLVLKKSVTDQLKFLMAFVKSQDELYANESFASKVKKGYVAMLYGPPGTGKTMTVSVMGKELDIDVYCIDLSRVVSKYIGETEKNLEKIFQRLEHKRCILFFDEADALFGKRTEVKDSKDRYANQEVAYLLQKIERFPGLVILTSNYNQNLDSAFRRRILSSIFMPPPSEGERLILWNRGLPDNFKFVPEGLPEALAKEHLLTGANIANVIKLGCIHAAKDKTNELTKKILDPIIKLELHKEKS